MALLDFNATSQQRQPQPSSDEMRWEAVYLERRANDARHRTTAPRPPETQTEPFTAKPATRKVAVTPSNQHTGKPATTRRRPTPERQRDLEETAARLTPLTKRRYRRTK